MPLLYEPEKDFDSFELTPDYDAVLDAWATTHPDQPEGPYFTAEEATAFVFTWPLDPTPKELRDRKNQARKQLRAANGQFAIAARKD